MFDNASGYSVYAKNALRIEALNKKPGKKATNIT